MKIYLKILGLILYICLSWGLIVPWLVSRGIGLLNDKQGWGWFLFAALILCPSKVTI